MMNTHPETPTSSSAATTRFYNFVHAVTPARGRRLTEQASESNKHLCAPFGRFPKGMFKEVNPIEPALKIG
jgi:hypothetical protein